jgi:hypothetical protein
MLVLDETFASSFALCDSLSLTKTKQKCDHLQFMFLDLASRLQMRGRSNGQWLQLYFGREEGWHILTKAL